MKPAETGNSHIFVSLSPNYFSFPSFSIFILSRQWFTASNSRHDDIIYVSYNSISSSVPNELSEKDTDEQVLISHNCSTHNQMIIFLLLLQRKLFALQVPSADLTPTAKSVCGYVSQNLVVD